MIEVKLITTEGCEACKIQDKILQRALPTAGKSAIMYTRLDCKDERVKELVKKYNRPIHDFPTTIILKNEELITHIEGTCTSKRITDIINSI